MEERQELDERLLEYGARVIKLVEALPRTLVGRRIGDQLLRSATSVGANYEEAQGTESKGDFVHKLQIALKEMRESHFGCAFLSELKPSPQNDWQICLTKRLSFGPCSRKRSLKQRVKKK